MHVYDAMGTDDDTGDYEGTPSTRSKTLKLNV